MLNKKPQRRIYDDQFKQGAVQMLLDGHSAHSVCQRLSTSVNVWESPVRRYFAVGNVNSLNNPALSQTAWILGFES